jgi:hypothetical protein
MYLAWIDSALAKNRCVEVHQQDLDGASLKQVTKAGHYFGLVALNVNLRDVNLFELSATEDILRTDKQKTSRAPGVSVPSHYARGARVDCRE